MQTTPIPTLSSPVNSANASANTSSASGETGAPAFDKVLSREVAERKNSEAPRKDGAARNESVPAQESAQGTKDAKPAGESEAAAEVAEEDKNAPADLLALVANIAQLQNGEAPAEGEAGEATEAEAAIDASGGRKRSSPFAAIHAAIGARANHGAQAKPDGTWAAQIERGTSGRLEAGKPELVLQAGDKPGLIAKADTGSSSGDFGATLKEVGQLMQPLQQQPNVQSAQSLANQMADKLSPRIGSQGWDQALGQKVVWMVKGEQQSASLTLNPPELGPLKVVLQVSNAQATATFVAAQPEVRQALEAAMPRLREMLDDAGIQLGQASVDSGSPHQEHASERQLRQAARMIDGADSGEPTVAAAAEVRTQAVGLGLVDTFV